MSCDGCKFTYQGQIQPVDPNDPEITVTIGIKNSLDQVVADLAVSFTPEHGECVESDAGCDPSSVCKLSDGKFKLTVGPGSAPSGVHMHFNEILPDGTRQLITPHGFVDPLIPTWARGLDGFMEKLMACGTDPVKIEAVFYFYDMGTSARGEKTIPFEFGCTACAGGEDPVDPD